MRFRSYWRRVRTVGLHGLVDLRTQCLLCMAGNAVALQYVVYSMGVVTAVAVMAALTRRWRW